MRWVVELPAPSGGTAATVTVDADSWAGALTHARGGSPIKKFRCEFDADNVVRVLDLSSREWYTIRPIRAVSPEATSAPAPAVSAPEPAPQAPAPQPFALARDEDAAPPVITPAVPEAAATAIEPAPSTVVPEVAEAPVATAAVTDEVAPPTDEVVVPASAPEPTSAPVVADDVPAAPARPTDTLFGVAPARHDESRLVAVDESGEHQALPGGLAPPTLLFQRDQEPSESNPLAYRERVFVVPEGTAVGDAELVARHALTALRRSLATHPRGRYVVVAVFDHRFETRPLRPALVELRWKDWRGDVEVTYPVPATSAAVNGATHADASGSVDVSAVVAAAASAPEETPAPAVTPVEVPAQVQVEALPAESPGAFVAAAVEAPVADHGTESPAPLTDAPAPAPVVEAPAPVVEAPAPAVEASAPVVEAPAPVVEAPAPAVEAPAPVVEAPAPVVEAPAPAVEAPAAVETAAVAPLEAAVATLPPPTVLASASEASVVVEPSAEPAPTVEAAASQGAEPSEAPQAPSAAAVASAMPVVAEAAAPPQEPAAPSAQTAAPRRDPRTIARRTRGKDLLGELFDALMDLSHMESADAGCKQVVQILQEHVQCDVAAVSLYDIDRDEFVVNSAFGADGVVGRRERAKVGVASTVVKRKAGVTLASCGVDDVIHDDLRDGGGVFAPAMFRERLFALVRVHRVPGAEAFATDELDALSYVAGQLGEFLSTQSKRAAAAEFAPEPRRSQAPPRR